MFWSVGLWGIYQLWTQSMRFSVLLLESFYWVLTIIISHGMGYKSISSSFHCLVQLCRLYSRPLMFLLYSSFNVAFPFTCCSKERCWMNVNLPFNSLIPGVVQLFLQKWKFLKEVVGAFLHPHHYCYFDTYSLDDFKLWEVPIWVFFFSGLTL